MTVIAQEIERQEKLHDIGVRVSKRIGIELTILLLKAYRNRDDVVGVLNRNLGRFEQHILDAMIAAHLLGRLRSTLLAVKRVKQTVLGPYDAATEFAKKRLELSEIDIQLLKTKYNDTAINITRGLNDVVEKKVKIATKEIVEQGMHVKQGMAHMNAAFKKAGISSANPWLIETLTRTQIQVAYSAGRWNANQEPEIEEILWGYEYITAGDARVRDEHEMLSGTRLPKEHPIWSSIWPPNGYNCRCEAIEIYKDETRRAITKEADSSVYIETVDPSWNFNTGEIYSDMISVNVQALKVPQGMQVKWTAEFAKGKKSSWQKTIDDLIEKGKKPNYSSGFWNDKRKFYYESKTGKKGVKGTSKVIKAKVKSVDQSTNFLREKYVKELQLDKIDPAFRKEIEDAYIEMRERFPLKKIKIRIGKTDAMAYYDGKKFEIVLDSRYFTTSAKYDLKGTIKEAYKKKILATKNIKEVIYHEYGHAIAKTTKKKGIDRIYSDFFRDFGDKHEQYLKLIKKQVSSYGAMNPHELMAESFVQYLRGGMSPIAKKTIKTLDLTKLGKQRIGKINFIKVPKKIRDIPNIGTNIPLTEAEIQMIKDYSVLKYPSEIGWKAYEKLSKVAKKFVDDLERALLKKSARPTTVFRGMRLESKKELDNFLSKMKVGKEYSIDAIQAATNDLELAEMFAAGDNPVMLKIKGKTLREITQYSKAVQEGEREFVFLRGARFKVVNVIQQKYYKLIELVELLY